MIDERDDDEVFELTEDMASIPPPLAASSGDEKDVSVPPHGNAGPFLQIAEPTPREKAAIPDPNSRAGSSRRRSFVPQKRDVAVLAVPIQNLSGDSGKASASRKKTKKGGAGKERVQEQKEAKIDSAAEQAGTTDDVEGKPEVTIAVETGRPGEAQEQVLDLGQELVVETQAEQSQPVEAGGQTEPATNAEAATAITSEPEAATGITSESPKEDLGTPEAVFDAFSEEVAGIETRPEQAAPEEEEIDLAGAEEITDGIKEEKSAKEDEEEEIDLAEAEDVTDSEKIAAPAESAGSLPAGVGFKMRRRRKRAKEWWAEIFDDDYMTLMPALNQRAVRREVDFVEQSLNVPKGSLLLDLCCGDGRHAVGLARRGYRVVGVDLSLPMLARAGELAQEAEQKINFIHGDMRDLGFDKTFDAVYCVGTSFGYFDEKTNFKVLEGVARALKPGAPFLLEVANRDHVIANQPNLTWFEGVGSVCMEETSFNYVNSRLDMVRNLILGENGRQVVQDLSLRLYSLHELGAILQSAGFAVSQIAGHIATPNAFFGADSSLIIIVASRRV